MVFIDRLPNRIAADSVVEDDHGGAYEAIEHLIAHGHRRIGFIGDALSVATAARRLAGYQAALTDAGIEPDPELVAMGADAAAAPAAHRLIGLADPPTAMFASNARIAIAVVPVLQALRRTDMAFISFGDFPLANALDPTLSVIDQDPNSVGQVAATRLFDRIDRPDRRFKRRIVLPVSLVPRASCCPDPTVRSLTG
jgi:LacI family transcriptional regulator